MDTDALRKLIEFLEEKASAVRRLEQEGDEVIDTDGQLAFQAKLEEKAELLAELGEKAWPLTEAIDGPLGEEVAQKLEQFSMSASTALRIGSVFFMTALLYPEDHQPGEPNDLETYILELKERAAD